MNKFETFGGAKESSHVKTEKEPKTALDKWLDSLEEPRPNDKENHKKLMDSLRIWNQKHPYIHSTRKEQEKREKLEHQSVEIQERESNVGFKKNLVDLLKEMMPKEGGLAFRISTKFSGSDIEYVLQKKEDEKTAMKIAEAINNGNLSVLVAALRAYKNFILLPYSKWHLQQREQWLKDLKTLGLESFDPKNDEELRRAGFSDFWTLNDEREFRESRDRAGKIYGIIEKWA